MTKKWPEVKLGDILTERSETPDPAAIASGQIRIVSKIGFDAGRIELRNSSETNTKMITIMPGDLVLSGINAAKGAIAIYPDDEEQPAAATIHYSSYEVNPEKASVEYLWWLLRSNLFRDILDRHMPGGIKTELKAKRLLPISIPLPELKQQNKIIKKIVSLQNKIWEANKLLSSNKLKISSLILSKLSFLLEGFDKEYGSVCLEELITKAGYGTSEKCNYEQVENCIPVLRIPNIASEKIDLNDLKFAVLTNKNRDKVLVEEDDLLVVRTNGSADLVGRCAVMPSFDMPIGFASYLIRLQCDKSRINSDYLQGVLRFLRADGQLFDLARTTAGQYNVSLGRLKSARIPLPPKEKQDSMVNDLNQHQKALSKIVMLHNKIQIELNALMPSILDKAFKGELI